METSRAIAIANAKLVLKQAGYFVDNLWHIDDVYSSVDGNVQKYQAMDILNRALQLESTIDSIWFAIDYVAREEELK